MAKRLIEGKKIFVAGCGLGGLSFALHLQRLCDEQGITPRPDVRLFERDSSPEMRAGQGYSLSVRGEGLQALQKLGIVEGLLPFREPGEFISIAGSEFKPLLSFCISPLPGLPVGKLRISRPRLRHSLLDLLPPNSVSYGKICTDARSAATDTGPVTLLFKDGGSEICDILVVADGSSSKLRAALRPEEQKSHAGICYIRGQTTPLDAVPSVLETGQRMAIASGGTTLGLSMSNQTAVAWALSFKASESRVHEVNAKLQNRAAAQDCIADLIAQHGSSYAEPWPTLLHHTKPETIRAMGPSDKLPHTNRAPIIFIGDACHPMTPFSGAGANQALQDGLQLAEQLTSPEHEDLAAAVAAYDALSVPRARQAVLSGKRNIYMFHSRGWTHTFVRTFLMVVNRLLPLVARLKSLRRT